MATAMGGSRGQLEVICKNDVAEGVYTGSKVIYVVTNPRIGRGGRRLSG